MDAETAAAREHRLVDLYEKNRVRIADRRLEVPREVPFTAAFNKWSANVPGTTYFLPVNEFTALYINIVLSAFDTDFAYFIVDDRNGGDRPLRPLPGWSSDG
jgi:hypothetical protein